MQYIDGFVIVVPKKNLKAYIQMAKKAGKIWMEYGALEYRECVGDDLNIKMGLPFAKLTKLKSNETVVFSFIVYTSKAHRNRVNEKVMRDSRIVKMCDPKQAPFDMKRMSYGGFKAVVSKTQH